MEEFLLGIDIGTSACKVAIFNREGNLAASGCEEYGTIRKRPGWAEQDPNVWWRAVCRAVKEMLEKSKIDPRRIAGVGVDGQSWAAVALNREGDVLTETPIWLDSRASDICRELVQSVSPEEIFHLSGNSLQPFYTTGKILWYKKNLPEIYRSIYKILQSNGFIAYRLTGKMTQDLSQGYGLHCFDIRKGKWDAEMCRRLGLPFGFLPDLYSCHSVIGTVTAKASKECGLCQGTPVVAGGLDAACGALGAGVIHSGETQEQGGQAGGMSICIDSYRADPRLILSFHVAPGKWLLQGGTTGGGGVLRWLEREFAESERMEARTLGRNTVDLLNDRAEGISPGSDGLIFLPYMAGERSPIWDPDAKGVYYGLDFGKTKGHFIHAAMEGVAFSLKHNLDVAEEAGAKVNVLKSMGGSANSILWTQIKSDVTGKPIVVPSSDTATTLGAAILAGVGTGVYRDFEEAVSLTVENRRYHVPNENNRLVYDKSYDTYRKVYENLKEIMDEKGETTNESSRCLGQ